MGGSASTEAGVHREKQTSERVSAVHRNTKAPASRSSVKVKDNGSLQYQDAREKYFQEDVHEMEWTKRVSEVFEKNAANGFVSLDTLIEVLRNTYGIHVTKDELTSHYDVSQSVDLNSWLHFHADLRQIPLVADLFAVATVSQNDWAHFVKNGMVLPYSRHVRPDFGGHTMEPSDEENNSSIVVPSLPESGSRFIKYLFSEDNDAVTSIENKFPVLNLPITKYFVRSVGNAFFGCSTAVEVLDLLKKRLKMGGRFITLDIWDPPAGASPEDAVVFKGCAPELPEAEVNKVTLKAVLETITSVSCSMSATPQGGQSTELPVLLSVTFLCEERAEEVCEAIKAILGPRYAKLDLPEDRSAVLPTLVELSGKTVLMSSPVDCGVKEEVPECVRQLCSFGATDPDEFFDALEASPAPPDLLPSEVAHLTSLDVCQFASALDSLSGTRLAQVRFERPITDNENTAAVSVAAQGFNPLRAWRYGVQCVPLDDFGQNDHAWIQHNLFCRFGNCGFVPKTCRPPRPAQPVYLLKVTVIMGKRIPRLTAETTPYIKLSFDSGTGSQQVAITTGQPEDNGMYCVWNETFTFKTTSMSQIQTLMFTVRDRDSPTNCDLAWSSVLLAYLRPGTRRVRLQYPDCSPVKGGKLLVHFQFTLFE